MRALRAEEYYTYEDWLALEDDLRAELIDGAIYYMSSPAHAHQRISGEIFRQFANFLIDKSCEVIAAFNVRLDKKRDTVFIPDISVICDPQKMTERACEGAPDLIVEILSPSTSNYDRFTKFHEYRNAGVLEYWIVDPSDKTITAHRLKDGEYVTTIYTDTGTAKTLFGCEIDLTLVFPKD